MRIAHDGVASPDGALPDTYVAPKHGWTCFHCGMTFYTPNSARRHFGDKPGDMAELRDALEAVTRERDELRAALNGVVQS